MIEGRTASISELALAWCEENGEWGFMCHSMCNHRWPDNSREADVSLVSLPQSSC